MAAKVNEFNEFVSLQLKAENFKAFSRLVIELYQRAKGTSMVAVSYRTMSSVWKRSTLIL